MKLLGKKLYRTRPIKLYKGGFGGGGGPGTGSVLENIAAPPVAPQAQPLTGLVKERPQPPEEDLTVEEKVMKEFRNRMTTSDMPPPHVFAQRDRDAMNKIRGKYGLPPLEIDPNSEFSFFRPGPGVTEPFNTPFGYAPENPNALDEEFIKEDLLIDKPSPGFDPSLEGITPPPLSGRPIDDPNMVHKPTGEIPPNLRPQVSVEPRPWDEEESFSFEQLIDDPGEGAPQPPIEIPWEQEPQLPSLSGGWGGPGDTEGPGLGSLTQLPDVSPPQRPVGNFPQRPVDHAPAEGPAGEGEVQTLRQTVAELRKEIASLRQQLAAAGGGGKPEAKPEIHGLPNSGIGQTIGGPTW